MDSSFPEVTWTAVGPGVFGTWLAILTVWQFGQGLIEGVLHGMYIDGTQ